MHVLSRHLNGPVFLALTFLFVLAFELAGAEERTLKQPGTLCVMTYNLRYASTNPPNDWPSRRPLVREVIEQLAPDIMGTQEGLFEQLKDIAQDAPEYRWFGVGRDDGRLEGEFMAIFYRADRLRPLSTNHFWLSDTPEMAGSSTWGNQNRRMVTWAKFRDLKTQKEFYALNTHFDHQIQRAREKSAELIVSRIRKLEESIPLLLLGDFNAAAGTNKAYHLLVQDDFLRDTWTLAATRRGEEFGTFNGFKEMKKGGPRIDWILARGNVSVIATEIVTFSRNGQFPSDHWPVAAWLSFGP